MARPKRGLKRSRPSDNDEGRSEADLKRQALKDLAPCRATKKRHLKDLSKDEIEAIISSAKKPFYRHQDIAKDYRVTKSLVGRLVRESARQPEKMRKRVENEKILEDKKDAIEDVVTSLVSFNTPIFRAGQIKDAVKEVAALEVDDLLVRRVMRKDLKMGYRLARQVPL